MAPGASGRPKRGGNREPGSIGRDGAPLDIRAPAGREAIVTRAIDGIVARGEVGGRTVQIVESGAVECHVYEPAPLPDGQVRVRTVRSAVSTGTEMTFYGRDASNVYL